MKTYKMTMSDGQRWDEIAHSAGDATNFWGAAPLT